MTKADLISNIAEDAGITKAQAESALNSFISNVTGALKQHEKVTLVGFGTFSVTRREARTGRNPRTSEAIEIPASTTPKFKPGKNLRDALND